VGVATFLLRRAFVFGGDGELLTLNTAL